MNHDRVKHYVSLAGIVALTAFGAAYLYAVPDPNAQVVLAVIASVAGLGGYSVRNRKKME